MAILNDLTKETSFRRFYLRWLVATWLPAIAATATWVVLTLCSPAAMQVLGFFVPLDLWAMIALGQWWFLRRYSRSAGLYAFLTFLGGVVGTVAWLAMRNDDPPAFMGMISLIVTPLLSYFIFGFDHPSLLVIAGTFLFGAALGCCQAWLMAPDRADRGMWIMFNGVLATVLLLSLFPYAMRQLFDIVWSRSLLASDPDLFDVLTQFNRAPVVLCAVWIVHAAAVDLFLGALRWRQVRRNRAGMVQVFD
jgi:hypothetical protein